MFDLTAIPIVQQLSHLPIIADPSHGTGIRDKVIPMARAAVAAGANGVLVEVHPNPERALSDGAQSLYPEQFAQLVVELRSIAAAIGRTITPAPRTDLRRSHPMSTLRARSPPCSSSPAAARRAERRADDRQGGRRVRPRCGRRTSSSRRPSPIRSRTRRWRRRGRCSSAFPGSYLVTFTIPAGDRIVSDGRVVWVYLPSTNPGPGAQAPGRRRGRGARPRLHVLAAR